MQISVRKVNPVKAFRQPDAAIGSHQTTPAQLMEYQEDGPAVNMPLPSVAASIMPSPLVAESPVSSELRNTDHVVPLEPVGSNASYFLFPPAQAAMLRTETAQSDISCSAVPDSGNRQSPEPAKMAFESTYLPSARNDHAQHAALHPSSSFASASGGACLDSGQMQAAALVCKLPQCLSMICSPRWISSFTRIPIQTGRTQEKYRSMLTLLMLGP